MLSRLRVAKLRSVLKFLILHCTMTDLLAFKAGRAFRRDDTNFVDPSPTKGAIVLQKGDDELLHFIWKNRSTNEVEEVSRVDIGTIDSCLRNFGRI